MDIAHTLGIKNGVFAEYIAYIENELASLETSATNTWAANLLTLMAEHRVGDFNRLAKIAESIGDRQETALAHFFAQNYYDRAIRFYQLLNAPRTPSESGERRASPS